MKLDMKCLFCKVLLKGSLSLQLQLDTNCTALFQVQLHYCRRYPLCCLPSTFPFYCNLVLFPVFSRDLIMRSVKVKLL